MNSYFLELQAREKAREMMAEATRDRIASQSGAPEAGGRLVGLVSRLALVRRGLQLPLARREARSATPKEAVTR